MSRFVSVDASLLCAAALVGRKASADVVVRVGADAPRSLPGFTSTFYPSTLDPFEPDHEPDKSRNDRQTNNKNQKGHHHV